MSRLALFGGPPVRTRPFPSWPVHGEEERRLLTEVLESGVWGALPGSKVPAFEQRFAAMHGVRWGIAATNGSHTLSIALQAAGVLPGDEVIVPAYTFVATAVSCLMVGALPVFADIDRESFLIDPASFEAAITDRTRAVIPVHIAGQMCRMEEIVRIARARGLAVIEDAAQAHLSAYDGRWTGQWGDCASFSFQWSKNATAGEGGIVLTDDDALADRVRSYQNCGRVKRGEWYEHHVVGSNYRMTEWQGALLLAQIDRAAGFVPVRERNAALLSRLLADIPGLRPCRRDPRATQVDYHLYMLRYDEQEWGVPRSAVLKAMAAEGVPCSSGYVPLYRQPLFGSEYTVRLWNAFRGQEPPYGGLTLPRTEEAALTGIWFDQRSLLGTEEDTADIAGAFAKLYEQRHQLRTA
jgi:dTDP-4-amino-4,6-dideoxygalactose transaminase